MSPILQTFLLLLYVVLVLQDDVHAFARTPSLTLHRHFVRTSSGAYPEFSVRRDLTTDDSPTSPPYFLFPGGGYVPNYFSTQGFYTSYSRISVRLEALLLLAGWCGDLSTRAELQFGWSSSGGCVGRRLDRHANCSEC